MVAAQTGEVGEISQLMPFWRETEAQNDEMTESELAELDEYLANRRSR